LVERIEVEITNKVQKFLKLHLYIQVLRLYNSNCKSKFVKYILD
jgi:hypothetical protein